MPVDYNVPATSRNPRYINIAPDGSLNLPPYLRNIVYEFEQLYENTRYKRLQPMHGRRRSLGGAVDGCGNPVYDKLHLRVICPTAAYACHGNQAISQGLKTATVKEEHKRCHSVDMGELRRINGAFQGDARSMEMTEVLGTVEHWHQRRFSVDLGHLRQFIALRELQICTKEESSP